MKNATDVLQKPSSEDDYWLGFDTESIGSSKKEYVVQFALLQYWFCRMSSDNKYSLIMRLLNQVRSIDSLSVILNNIYTVSGKAAVYAESQYIPKSIFDKPMQDHNRSLVNQTIKEKKDECVNWFYTLKDSDQAKIIIELLQMSGGFIIRKFYKELANIYNKKTEIRERLPSFSVADDVRSFQSDDSEFKKQKLFISAETMSTVYDPKHPLSEKANECQKKFNAKITSYEKEIQDKDSEYNLDTLKKKEKKSKKKNKKGKGGKSKNSKKTKSRSKSSSKTSKNSKSSKKKNKKSKKSKSSKKSKQKMYEIKENECVDKLQMLPIWVMKNILNYLDNKTLNKMKEVNTYWEYVIDEIFEEKKLKQQINKTINFYQKELNELKKKHENIVEQKYQRIIFTVNNTEKRLVKLFRRGCVHPKLRFTKKDEQKLQNADFESIKLSHNSICENDNAQKKLIKKITLQPKIDCTLTEPYYNPQNNPREMLEFKNKTQKFKEDIVCKI